MIYKKIYLFIIAVILCLFLFAGQSMAADINQQILDLRAQVEALTKQAEQYKKNITTKRKEADTLARQIDILNNQILKLTAQISITEKQIGTVKLQISDLETKIFDAQERIISEKASISKLISEIYKRDRLSVTAILLKNPKLSDFSDEIQQDNYLNSKLNEILALVKKEKEELQNNKTDLENKKQELELLNNRQLDQKYSVEDTRQNKDKLLKVTKGKELEYQKLLSAVEKKEAEFYDELKRLEAEAVKSGAFIVHITANYVPTKQSWPISWPEDDYYITQSYGMTSYAKRGVYGGSPHNGIDMSSGFGSPIHPVANGAILASGTNSGFGNWTAVLHDGGVVSIYGHFRSPSGLANGTKVTSSSIIGYEGSTGNSTGSHLHLSIYKDFFTYINPKNGQLYFNYFAGSLNPLNYLP